MGVLKKQQTNRPFEKFTFISSQSSGLGSLEEEKARKILVRSHARRAATKQQRSSVQLNSSAPKISDPESQIPLSGHIQIFRVKTPATSRRRELKIKPTQENKWRTLDEDIYESSPKVATIHPYQPVQVSRKFGLLDPFDSFPVPLRPPQRRLLYYYTSTLAQSFISFDPDRELLAQAYVDPAWLNATFSLVALHHDLQAGRGISSECLFYRGEALRIVNERLSSDSTQIMSDSTMGAVASLANFDITIGSTSNAAVHMDGLQHLVKMRGGLRAVNQNRLVGSLISWSDLLYSTARHSQPRFKFMCELLDIADIPICVTDLKNYFQHTENHPGFNLKMRETVRILRNVSLKKPQISASKAERTLFSNCMYLAEYRLVTLFDDCAPNDISMSIRRPWSLGTHLYIHLALRDLPGSSQVEYNLVRQLKEMLEHGSEDLLILWRDNLGLLLWLLFMGSIAAGSHDESFYFTEQIIRLNHELDIYTSWDFQNMLKKVMWLPAFCEPHSTQTWRGVERMMAQLQLPSSCGTTPDFEEDICYEI